MEAKSRRIDYATGDAIRGQMVLAKTETSELLKNATFSDKELLGILSQPGCVGIRFALTNYPTGEGKSALTIMAIGVGSDNLELPNSYALLNENPCPPDCYPPD